MDIDLLSRMVAELIVKHDQVGLPGVGTFVAEMVPATFSDKGFTINPPYRRLSFYPSRTEDTLLIDLYAQSNQLSREVAKTYITQYLAELKSILEERKSVTLPGLGRLRATRENTLFFVQDEGLDIFPAGIGLEPVSLKSHVLEEEEPVVIDVPLPQPEEPEAPEEPEVAAEPVDEPEPAEEPEAEPQPAEEEPDTQEPAEESEDVPAEETPAEESAPESDEPESEPEERPSPQLSFQTPPSWIRDETWREPRRHKTMPWIVKILLILIVLAILALCAFMVLARLAPDFIDSLLYTPDELRIINY